MWPQPFMNLGDPEGSRGLMVEEEAWQQMPPGAPDILRGRGRGLGSSPSSELGDLTPCLSTWSFCSQGPVLISVAPEPCRPDTKDRQGPWTQGKYPAYPWLSC